MIDTSIAVKAPLASPALTGTPTAPTAAAAANTTQIATTAFVKTAIAALVASSPAALDTLNELAAALGNDPNFATTMTNALAGKAPLASPALTGNPTAPTQAAGDNSTRLATTAFVRGELGRGSAKAWVNFNGSGTVAIRSSFNVSSITDNGTGSYTVNFIDPLPSASFAATAISTEAQTIVTNSNATGSVSMITRSGSGNSIDATQVSVAVFGD
jgi:hypothetical protein